MYYPLSQITPNLYTNGGEFINSITKENYIGYYFKTSKGEYFTGRDSNNRPNILLTPFSSTTSPTIVPPTDNLSPSLYNIDSTEVINYLLLNNKTKTEILNPTLNLPVYNPNVPTQQDYQIGEFRRYFCKKTNEFLYLEINKDTYDKLINKDVKILYQLYKPFKIKWQIAGDKEKVYNGEVIENAPHPLPWPGVDEAVRELLYPKYEVVMHVKTLIAFRITE